MNEEDKKPKIDWCPTSSGTTTAYLPEYFAGGEWKRIPLDTDQPAGVPPPKHKGALYRHLGLMGYEEAMAVAWWFAAIYKADNYQRVGVRLQKYRFIHELKALKMDMCTIELYPRGGQDE